MIQEILYIGHYKPKYNKQYIMEEKLTRKLEYIILNDIWKPYSCKECINNFDHLLDLKINRTSIEEKQKDIFDKQMRVLKEEALTKHYRLI